jgi:hypothetical protein
MRRRGRRRYTSTRHCSGGVPAVGALIESAPVMNFHGQAVTTQLKAKSRSGGNAASTFPNRRSKGCTQ